MCDTFVAMPDCTAAHVTLFGKNSDRQRNEAQAVELVPGASHAPGTHVRCTYMAIPQAPRTYAALVCRPFWMWGAEMGVNERGVAIGNEGVQARSAAPQEPALIGMDLVRLGVERSATASEAVEVITQLLRMHGQGGNCGHLKPSYYNNSFLIADSTSAFVLETVDREWMVEQVSDVRAISNAYSIGSRPSRTSEGLLPLLRESGWSTEAEPDFAAVMSDPNTPHIGTADLRRACSTSLMRSRRGRMSARDAMSILRDHGPGGEFQPSWTWESAVTQNVCMHAGAEDRPAQTVGSLVCELYSRDAVHWVTATAAPCISIFKPVLLDVPLPMHGPALSDRYDPRTLWWRHERLHRAALTGRFGEFLESIRAERDHLEAEFQGRVAAVRNGGDAADRARVVTECWQDAIEAEGRWQARITSVVARAGDAYVAAWELKNRIAGLDLSR